jgi:hypothetical protein
LEKPERDRFVSLLAASGDFSVASEQDGMLNTQLYDTDVSFIHQHHRLLEPLVNFQGVHLAKPTDIGLMLVAAINSRGMRRDFIDLSCLRDRIALRQLFELASIKYDDRPNFLAVAARSLVYFADAEQQPMPQMRIPVQWEDVRANFQEASVELGRRLSGLA